MCCLPTTAYYAAIKRYEYSYLIKLIFASIRVPAQKHWVYGIVNGISNAHIFLIQPLLGDADRDETITGINCLKLPLQSNSAFEMPR